MVGVEKKNTTTSRVIIVDASLERASPNAIDLGFRCYSGYPCQSTDLVATLQSFLGSRSAPFLTHSKQQTYGKRMVHTQRGQPSLCTFVDPRSANYFIIFTSAYCHIGMHFTPRTQRPCLPRMPTVTLTASRSVFLIPNDVKISLSESPGIRQRA